MCRAGMPGTDAHCTADMSCRLVDRRMYQNMSAKYWKCRAVQMGGILLRSDFVPFLAWFSLPSCLGQLPACHHLHLQHMVQNLVTASYNLHRMLPARVSRCGRCIRFAGFCYLQKVPCAAGVFRCKSNNMNHLCLWKTHSNTCGKRFKVFL